MRILLVLIGFILSVALYSQGQCPNIKWSEIYTDSTSTGFIENDGRDKFFVMTGTQTGNLPSGTFQGSNVKNFISCIDTASNWQWHTITNYSGVGDFDFNRFTQTLYVYATIDASRKFGSDSISVFPGERKYILSALSASGTFLWTKTLLTVSKPYYAYGNTLGSDSLGNIYIGTNDTTQIDSNKIAPGLIKLDKFGNFMWNQSIDGTARGVVGPHKFGVVLETMKGGKSWVSIRYQDSITIDQQKFNTNGIGNILGMIDKNGSWIWYKQTQDREIFNFKNNRNGYCYALRENQAAIHTISLIDSSGNTVWSKPEPGGSSSLRYDGIDCDLAGNLYCSILLFSANHRVKLQVDSVKFDSWTPTSLICKIDTGGNYLWAGDIHGYSTDLISCLNSQNIMTYTNGSAVYGLDSVSGAWKKRSALMNMTEFGNTKIEVRKDTTINCGDSIRLNTISNSAGELYYQWSSSSGNFSSKASSPWAKPASTTTYKVRAMRSGGCVDSASVTIQVNPQPRPAPHLIFQGSTGSLHYCGSNFSVEAPSGFTSYLWENGDTTRTFSPPGPGTYRITVTTAFGCVIEDSVLISPLAKMQPGPHQYLCSNYNDSLKLSAFAPLSFDSIAWNTGETNAEIYVSKPGTYWFTLWKNGCVWRDTALVEYFSDTANADFNYWPIDQHGKQIQFEVHSDGLSQLNWSFGDGNSDFAINPTHVYNSYGSYTVCLSIRDICGYRDTVCKEIQVQKPVNIDEVPHYAIELYPNPAGDVITIESNAPLSTDPSTRLQMIDIRGKVIQQHALVPGVNTLELELISLRAGLYFLKIGDQVFKLVKE